MFDDGLGRRIREAFYYRLKPIVEKKLHKAGGINDKIFPPDLFPKKEDREKYSLKWDDVKEMLEMIDSFDKFKDIVLNTDKAQDKFFDKLTTKADKVLRPALYARLEPKVTEALAKTLA